MKKIIAISTFMALSLFSCNDSKTPVAPEISQETTQSAEPVEVKHSGEDIVLTMAVTGGNPYVINGNDIVQEFNDADNGYKIVLKDYAEGINTNIVNTDETMSNYNMRIFTDISEGGNVDIIPCIFTDKGKFYNLAQKGAFQDLNTFLDEDDEINHDTLIDNVLQACIIEDKLCYMPLSFSINTLAGPSKYVGNKENWTFEEMKEHWDKMPEGSTINWDTKKDTAYRVLLRGCLSSFIDYDNAECHFDSDEFVNMLTFVNSFDDPVAYKDDMFYNTPLFLFEESIYSFRKFHNNLYRENYQTDEPITYVGYPTSDNSGTFVDTTSGMVAISAFSSDEKKKGAWEFISMLVSYENQYQSASSDDNGFPINKKAFEDMGRDQYIHENEEKMIDTVGGKVNEGFLSKAEYDKLVELINNAKNVSIGIEDDIFDVIEDEIFNMINGQKDPQQTAEDIQNRVQVLVSERS